MANGKVQRAWLGIQLAELTPELAEGFSLKEQKGVLVQDVMAGTPAERAGLRRNDVIVEFDGQPVSDMAKFRLRVADTKVGSRVPVVVLRDGKRMTFEVTLSERNANAVAQAQPSPETKDQTQGVAGATVRDLTDEEKREAKVQNGVMVTDVEDGSAADEVGLEAGDIIEQIGGKPVDSATSFSRMLKEARAGRKYAALLVRNKGFVALRLAD